MGSLAISISYNCFINLIRPASKYLSKTNHYKNKQIWNSWIFVNCLLCVLFVYMCFPQFFCACSWHLLYILLVDSFFVSAKHFDIIQTPLYKVKFQTNAKRALASIHQATPVFRRFSVSFYNYFKQDIHFSL